MTKRRAAPAAITQPAPDPTLPERIRSIADQLIRRAAATGPDLELGSIGLTLAVIANDVGQELATLAFQRDLAAAHDQQPYPTAWAYDQACKAVRKHHDRAEAAEAAVARVRALAEGEYYGITGRAFLAALDGPTPTPDDAPPEPTTSNITDWATSVDEQCPAHYTGDSPHLSRPSGESVDYRCGRRGHGLGTDHATRQDQAGLVFCWTDAIAVYPTTGSAS